MQNSISFIMNNQEILTELPRSTILLDFIRYHQKLPGTKIGCREGDCGACTVLVGNLTDIEIEYKAIVSCLTPIGNVEGKHIVTIEGLNKSTLTRIQQEIVDEGGTQCGFCTPGFITSLTAFSLDERNQDIIDAISGNICRCTGYKSIEKAAFKLDNEIRSLKFGNNRVETLINNGFIPDYFIDIKERLIKIKSNIIDNAKNIDPSAAILVGGGTDLYVQQPDTLTKSNIQLVNHYANLKYIREENGYFHVGAGVTATEFEQSNIINQNISHLKRFHKLFASRLIRNTATIGGNLANASPIGDFIILLLALEAKLNLQKNNTTRSISLNKFYLGYKNLDLEDKEIIESISFQKLSAQSHFNFEKVSKRTHLDIASVNSAISITIENKTITHIALSAGGLAPVPKYLESTCNFLLGKQINSVLIKEATKIAQNEVSPISDIRGSREYKLLLLRQLIYSHFMTLFPDVITFEELIN